MKKLMIVSVLICGTYSFGQETCSSIKSKISLYDADISLYQKQIDEYGKKMNQYTQRKDSDRSVAINYAQYKGMRDEALNAKARAQSKKSDAQSKLRNCKD